MYAHINSDFNEEAELWVMENSMLADVTITYDVPEDLQPSEQHDILLMLSEIIRGPETRPINKLILTDLDLFKLNVEYRQELLTRFHDRRGYTHLT